MRPILLALLAAVTTTPAAAQESDRPPIPLSQRAGISQRVGYTDIAITYNRPVARGRELFGGIVNWGRIWNPGADSATTLSFSDDVTMQGHHLAAGRYTLWMIPKAEGPWTIIVSRAVDIFHSPYPGEEHDAVRMEVTPVQGAHMEVLAFYFPIVARDSAVLRMHWGQTAVPLTLRTVTPKD